jgi:mRNA-degrading endonuclease toxin of MazEF toxin-antitoxin module
MNFIEKIVEWTKLKCRIQSAPEREIYFREREIWWASIGANIGSEQNGKNELFERPVLILKVLYGGSLLLIAPIRSGGKASDYYFRTRNGGRIQSVIFAQIRVISAKRLVRKLRVMPFEEFTRAKEHLKRWL